VQGILPPALTRDGLSRAVQALTNVVKHSGASHATVRRAGGPAGRLHGQLRVESEAGAGTLVAADIRLPG
jgi:signal transduction histidine kinase